MFNEGWTADFSAGLQWRPPGHSLGGTLPISQKKGWSSQLEKHNMRQEGGKSLVFRINFMSSQTINTSTY